MSGKSRSFFPIPWYLYMSVDGMQTLAQQGILGFDPTLEKDIELVEAMSYFTEGGVTDTDLRPAKCACGG